MTTDRPKTPERDTLADDQTQHLLLKMMEQHREDVDQRLASQTAQTDRRFTELAGHVTALTKQVAELTKTLAQREGARVAVDHFGHKAALVVAALSGVVLDHIWKVLF